MFSAQSPSLRLKIIEIGCDRPTWFQSRPKDRKRQQITKIKLLGRQSKAQSNILADGSQMGMMVMGL